MKKKTIALFAGLSLAFVSSAALAAPSADTLLVAGYDSDQMAVLYGVSSIDQDGDELATLDCTLSGVYTYTVGERADDGRADVESLATDNTTPEGDTLFEAETVVTDGDIPAPILYDELFDKTDEDGRDCLLTSVLIEPKGDGEVNHGTVVSTFAKLYKGCIVRHFAQTDWGKTDSGNPDAGEVTLESIRTSCDKQKDKDAVSTLDDDASSGGKATAPGQANKADKANKGGSKANPPGRNK